MVLHQLMDAGRMPNLSRLVEAGVMGNLASLRPCLTPMLWTSIATGKTADEHGILGFVEPRADGLGVVPSRSSSRQCKAVWNLLEEAGKRCCVVAWPISDPVESISGVYVSERMSEGLADRLEEIGPAPKGCVHPATLEPFVSELRLHPCELALSDLSSMIPDIGEVNHAMDNRPAHLARSFARCVSVHSVATAAMAAEPWDFFAVYYEAIDRVGHDFMQYRVPRMEHVSEQDFARYRNVMDGLYEFHDAMLGKLLDLAGEDTTVVLLSDHGFQSGPQRPVVEGLAAEAADWHRMLGVLAMKGPGLKQDERIYGATLLDIVPTMLTLFGLPVGKDMPGRVLSDAFVAAPETRWIDSWEGGGERDFVPPAVAVADPASLRQLAALGYIGQDAVEGAGAARLAKWEASFNLATVHLHHERPVSALPLLEELCREAPEELRYQHSRLLALSHLGRHKEVLAGVEELEAAGSSAAQFDLLAAAALAGLGQGSEVMSRLRSAAEREPLNAVVALVSGDYLLAQGRLQHAAECYAKAIALDPESALALSGMAQVQLELGNFAESAASARSSLQQVFLNPVAHFRLGQALAGLGDRGAARRAYERALEQAPAYGEALYRLAALLEADGDFLGAAEFRRRLSEGN